MGVSRVFWDTNLFIYFLEDYGSLTRTTEQLRARMLDRGDQLLTSTMTLGELLVKPTGEGRTEVCRHYEQLLQSAALLLAFDAGAARVYAALRADKSLRAPDAIQLACAATAGVDLFITNDDRLQGKQIPGIQFIVSLSHSPI
jgi:predicted nucleic acid-binding protein